MIQRSDIHVVSLFSGCGGLDCGFEKAGFSVCFYNDSDRFSCDTLRLNGKQNVYQSPIEQLSVEDAKKTIGSNRGECDVLIGGPPCQPFSKAAYWSKGDTLRLNDPRAHTLEHYFRFVEGLLPRVFMLENVRGLNYNGKEEGYEFIIERIKSINSAHDVHYVPSWSILNVADYGVPQARERFFLVAERTGKRFPFPEPTHRPSNEIETTFLGALGVSPYVTAWEAIGNLPEDPGQNLKAGGKWGDLLPSIPEGENYLWHTARKGGLPLFGWRTRYWSFLLKLSKKLPSWTIQAQPGPAIGPFHWQNRKLSWQEMAAIQTFPSDFIIEGPRSEIQRQIGNAVPSLMAEILAREIGQRFFGLKYHDLPTLSIPRRTAIPDAEPVQEVPEKYLHLLGDHAPHPGTGKGRRYTRNDRENTQRAANQAVQ